MVAVTVFVTTARVFTVRKRSLAVLLVWNIRALRAIRSRLPSSLSVSLPLCLSDCARLSAFLSASLSRAHSLSHTHTLSLSHSLTLSLSLTHVSALYHAIKDAVCPPPPPHYPYFLSSPLLLSRQYQF